MTLLEKRAAILARIADGEDVEWLKVVLAQIERALAMGKV